MILKYSAKLQRTFKLTDKWTYFCLTKDGFKIKFYKDGIRDKLTLRMILLILWTSWYYKQKNMTIEFYGKRNNIDELQVSNTVRCALERYLKFYK